MLNANDDAGENCGHLLMDENVRTPPHLPQAVQNASSLSISAHTLQKGLAPIFTTMQSARGLLLENLARSRILSRNLSNKCNWRTPLPRLTFHERINSFRTAGRTN
jgi:hypothetical protein